MIKWFWTNINFRKWTFEGRKLANPFMIIWRILMIIPIYILLGLLCGILISTNNKNTAEEIWDFGRPF